MYGTELDRFGLMWTELDQVDWMDRIGPNKSELDWSGLNKTEVDEYAEVDGMDRSAPNGRIRLNWIEIDGIRPNRPSKTEVDRSGLK